MGGSHTPPQQVFLPVKIRQREGDEGMATTLPPPWTFLSYFSNHEDCIQFNLGWVYITTISKRSDKQWLIFKEGRGREGDNNHPPPSWSDMLAEMTSPSVD